MTQYRSERILAIGSGLRQFQGFTDGRTQRSLMVGVCRKYILAGTCRHGRRWCHLRSESIHNATAVRLLLIRYLNLVYSGLEAEEACGVCQRCAPLACAGLGGDVGDTLLLAIICLGDGTIEFVRSHGADTLVLKVDMSGCTYGLLKAVGTYKRRGAPIFVHITYLLGYLYPFVLLVELLTTKFFGKDGEKVFGLQRLAGGGV